ncbi:uncharacterized protein PV06_05597 [Exophiala oligosperma]|uniref:AB hydrolase-1 domain-containing protein n=1 Tax=Exophiala oligosperma TaxID=215243 RepID=A0A0D2BX25_9EURO|nr:uncharacterized protein PV06_05597 [Exophiala oligosperma]KIW42007.1 hypothetical protein PV06_05597 [Exophiala oligosperma]
MRMMSLSKSTSLPDWRLFLAGTCFFAAGALTARLFGSSHESYIYRSPRSTLLPRLSDAEKGELPYPPDVLPGARDVDTPYGSIRVYEFGPEDGRKVLLVHGISTPAVSLGAVANALVDKHGCRVMLFDLFGRGYSDTANDVRHDVRLFTTQILLVLASSPLSWTGKGSGKFALVGYSLGGGIATTFTSYFGDLVDSLILFAPAGLLRPYHISRQSRIIYSEGIIPETLLQRLVKRRLRTPLAPPPPPEEGSDKTTAARTNVVAVDATQAVQAEVNIESNSRAIISKARPHVTVEKAVSHQLDNHPGFVPAFISSIRHGPIRTEHDRWRIVGERLRRQNKQEEGEGGGKQKKVLIVLGAKDPIIIRQEVEEDATALLGPENVEFAVFDAAHDVPIVMGSQVVDSILDFWKRTD